MSRVRSLVRSVQRGSAAPSRYADLLDSRLPGAAGMNSSSLAKEVASEIAYSLGRAGKKIEAALETLERLEAELSALETSRSRDELRAQLYRQFNQQRAIAERSLWELRVQREALGFRRHDELSVRFRIPAAKPEHD